MTHIAPGKIGKYEVEARIGEGAMGVVYRARDPVLDRAVAIKVMSDAFAQNDDLRERFLREAQAAGSLQHPNIITIYDFGDFEGHPYIAMEFVEGQDLSELLAHEVPLTLTHKLDVAIGLLQGLAFAHRRGIVHRDIKPANVRVDSDGNARIIDFGVVHLASSEMTRSGVMLGTPSYMAPEQIVGGKVGPQTDIFSAGAVLYELLTGFRPFAGGTLQEVMYRVLSEPPKPLAELAPELPPKLNDVVVRALAKDPEDRYANALEMANDLSTIRAEIAASPASTLSLRATIESALEGQRRVEVRRSRWRHTLRWAGGAAAAGVLLTTGWLLASRSPQLGRHSADTVAATHAAETPTVSNARPGGPAATLAGEASAPVRAAAPRPVTRRAPDQSDPSTRSPEPRSTQPPVPTSIGRDSTQHSVGVPGDPALSAPAVPSPSVTPATRTPLASTGSATGATAPPVAPPATAPVNPTGSTASAASARTATNSSADIAAVIDAYARAIESRDLAELRRTYATITADQSHAFSDFFASTRELRATLGVQSVHVDGNVATARVSGVYQFTTTAGHAERQPVTFDVELHHDGGSWHLVAVR